MDLVPEPGHPLPAVIACRYPALDGRVWGVLGQVRRCARTDDSSWLLGADDYTSTSSAFRWNEYEEMALDAAISDADRSAIRSFWDAHLPFLLAVHSDYDYLAIRVADGAIVHGFAPEWEQPEIVAANFDELVERLTGEPSSIYPWSALV